MLSPKRYHVLPQQNCFMNHSFNAMNIFPKYNQLHNPFHVLYNRSWPRQKIYHRSQQQTVDINYWALRNRKLKFVMWSLDIYLDDIVEPTNHLFSNNRNTWCHLRPLDNALSEVYTIHKHTWPYVRGWLFWFIQAST